MSNRILTAEGWQGRVRDKLGISDAYLPDTTLNQPECITIAEANIIKIVPDYASLSGDDRVYLEAATVCECAVIVCSTMKARLPERTAGPHAQYDVKADWNKRRTELESERNRYLAEVVTIPAVTYFKVSR